MNDQVTTLKTLLQEKKALFVLIALAILIPVLFLLLSPSPKKKAPAPLVNKQTAPTVTPSIIPEPTDDAVLPEEEKTYAWGEVSFAESDIQGVTLLNKESLPDGSTAYTFTSENSQRSDMIIVQNGIIVFTRSFSFGTIVETVVEVIGKPDALLREPTYYGQDTVTYVYAWRGLALTVDPKTGTVFEQFVFKPTTLAEFNQKYKAYIK